MATTLIESILKDRNEKAILKKTTPKASERKLVIFSFTDRGGELAKKIASRSPAIKTYGGARLKKGGLKKLTARAFKEKTDILFISATGIAVRTIAPLLKGKDKDPAIVVIDDHACHAISLLSGHLGGANELTLWLAKLTGARAVITTATDLAGVPCIEELANGFDLTIDGKAGIKKVNSAILRNEKVIVVDANKKRRDLMQKIYKRSPFIFKSRQNAKTNSPRVVVTASLTPLSEAALLLRPKEYVVGIGCMRGTSERAIHAAIKNALAAIDLSILSIKNLATAGIKSNEAGLLAFAKKNSLTIEFFSKEKLNSMRPPSGVSKAAMKHLGVPGVSENSALLSSGAKKLCLKKIKTKKVTVAVAKAAS